MKRNLHLPMKIVLFLSQDEKRYYCPGKVGDGILTVRFIHRDFKIRIIGAGYWRKGKKIYEERNKLY